MATHSTTLNTPVQNPLLTAPISGLIRKIGVPVGIGAFFNTMFNVVDTYYAGLISNQALAALGLSFPIFFVIIALAFGLSSGNTALMGNALGADDKEGAERYAVQGMMLGFFLALGLTFAGVAASPFLFGIMGGRGELLPMSLSYINPIFYGTIFFVMAQMLNAVLNATGKTTYLRNVLVGGFLLNLLLDPWFIRGGLGVPAMGITGIGLATTLVQFLGMLYLIRPVARSGLISRAGIWRNLIPQPRVVAQILGQGLPNIIDMCSISIGFFVLNYFVGRFGQEAIAAFGAAARIEQLAMLPLIGLDVATLSLIAQNNGARMIGRVHETFGTSIRYGLLIMLVGATTIALLANPLMDLFSDDPQVIGIGANYIRIKALGLFPVSFMFVALAAMRGVKRPVDALWLSMVRMVILPLILLPIFINWLGFGLTSIWWISNVTILLVGVASYLYAKRLLPAVN
ncbi:MAG: MATE family efflux transporter [Chloroflexota bacterium]